MSDLTALAEAGRQANLVARLPGETHAALHQLRVVARADIPDLYLGMNKTEKRRAEELEAMKQCGEIAGWWGGKASGITLQLAFDTRYTPDFLIQENDGRLRLEEIKGFWRDDAKVKVKLCAKLYPFPIRIVQAKKGGGWTFTPVHP